MKKDLEWLKSEIGKVAVETSCFYPYHTTINKSDIIHIIDQLDEPETLSEYWLEPKSIDDEGRLYVWKSDLQALLVSEQKLPVVPTWFDEWWKDVTKGGGNLFHNIERFYDELFSSGTSEMYSYIGSPDNKKKLLNIIINELEYVVEKDQRYILSINITDKASKTNYETFLNKRGIFHSMDNGSFNSEEFNWSEEEIKGLENGEILFEHFAVKVEELEE